MMSGFRSSGLVNKPAGTNNARVRCWEAGGEPLTVVGGTFLSLRWRLCCSLMSRQRTA